MYTSVLLLYLINMCCYLIKDVYTLCILHICSLNCVQTDEKFKYDNNCCQSHQTALVIRVFEPVEPF